jgi:hypothetical protein
MGWTISATRGGPWVTEGKPLLDSGVMTMGSNRVDLFSDFIHEPPMERPGATRGGKRKPFLEVGG